MFSGDDSLDFDDEEFARVALDLEAVASTQNTEKRKSFELVARPDGAIPASSTGSPVLGTGGPRHCIPGVDIRVAVEGDEHEVRSPPLKRRSFEIGPILTKNTTVNAKPEGTITHSSGSRVDAQISRTFSAKVLTSKEAVVTRSPPLCVSRNTANLQIQNKTGATDEAPNPLGKNHGIDFDLDDLDLDLSLEEPSSWAPSLGANPAQGTNLQRKLPVSEDPKRFINIPKEGITHDSKQNGRSTVVDNSRALRMISVPSNVSNKGDLIHKALASTVVLPECIEPVTIPKTLKVTEIPRSVSVKESRRSYSPEVPRLEPVEAIQKPNESVSVDTGSNWSGDSDQRSTAKSGKKRKRKFPGPAGLLPKLKPGMHFDDVKLNEPATPNASKLKNTPEKPEPDLICSQSSEDVFFDVPWQTMKKGLEKRAHPIIEAFNVSAILRKASLKQLPRGKIPITCVLIDQLQVHTADASVMLRDPSGQMKGTIHRQIMKEYASHISPGTVLVLKQVGVFSPSVRNHYLNITPSNLARMYYKDTTGSVLKLEVAQLAEEDFKIHAVSQLNRTLSDSRLDQRPQNTPGNPTLRPLVPNRGASSSANAPRTFTPRAPTPVLPNTGRGQFQSTPSRGGFNNQGARTPQQTNSMQPPPLRAPHPRTLHGSHTPTMNTPRAPQVRANTTPNLPPNSQGNLNATPSRTFSLKKQDASCSPNLRGTPSVRSIQQPSVPRANGIEVTTASSVAGTTASVVPPKRPAHSNGVPLVRNTDNNDLWEDDQLDDLLTGLEDEMLEDF